MIKVNYLTAKDSSKLLVKFEPNQGMQVLENILHYPKFKKFNYYYFFWGYSEYSMDIERYFEKYPELRSDKGILQLKDEDKENTQLIYDLLNEYQIVSLYINNSPDLTKDFDFVKWRDSREVYEGYVIDDFGYDYVKISRKSILPDWNFEKMGFYS